MCTSRFCVLNIRARRSVFVLWLACVGYSLSAIASELRPGFFVYPNAKNVRWSKRGPQLTYQVDIPYPAQPVLTSIATELSGEGWKPLANDFLNPSLPASKSNGWETYRRGISLTGICVHQWIQDWKDSAGNLVRYTFVYEHTGCDTSALRELQVFATYTSAEAARDQQRAIEKWKAEHSPKKSE